MGRRQNSNNNPVNLFHFQRIKQYGGFNEKEHCWKEKWTQFESQHATLFSFHPNKSPTPSWNSQGSDHVAHQILNFAPTQMIERIHAWIRRKFTLRRENVWQSSIFYKTFAHSITECYSFYGISSGKMSHFCYMLHCYILSKFYLFANRTVCAETVYNFTWHELLGKVLFSHSREIDTKPVAQFYHNVSYSERILCPNRYKVAYCSVQFNLCILSKGERERKKAISIKNWCCTLHKTYNLCNFISSFLLFLRWTSQKIGNDKLLAPTIQVKIKYSAIFRLINGLCFGSRK